MTSTKTTPSADLKASAMDFMRKVAAGQVGEAYALHVGPAFRHHNPFFRGDAESLRKAMQENAHKNPNKIFEIQRALQDGDYVAVHSRIRQHPPASAGSRRSRRAPLQISPEPDRGTLGHRPGRA